jgi:hypothetical protein
MAAQPDPVGADGPPVVHLAPEGSVAALRLVAHVEAGHQVVYHGDMTAEAWWPATQGTVMDLLKRRER